MNETGRILVVEGVDGCGKTTACRALSRRNGWKYARTPVGVFKEHINDIERLGDHALAYSYFVSALLNTSYLIKKDVDALRTVICDRYLQTLSVYFEAIGYRQEFIDTNKLPILRADITVHLYVDYERILERLGKKRALSVDETRLRSDRGFYERLVAGYRRECGIEVDATDLSIDQVVGRLESLLRV
jgi:thymidylate kinase